MREVSAEIRLPAFAIGGIGPENIHQAVSAGFSRVAVHDAAVNAADPGSMARTLREALEGTGDQ